MGRGGDTRLTPEEIPSASCDPSGDRLHARPYSPSCTVFETGLSEAGSRRPRIAAPPVFPPGYTMPRNGCLAIAGASRAAVQSGPIGHASPTPDPTAMTATATAVRTARLRTFYPCE